MAINESRDNLEYMKAVLLFYPGIEKGWITTEDGQHLFLGGDGTISGGKAAYEAHQNESKGGSGSDKTDTPKSNKNGNSNWNKYSDKELQEIYTNLKTSAKILGFASKGDSEMIAGIEIEAANRGIALKEPGMKETKNESPLIFKSDKDAEEYFGEDWQSSLSDSEILAVNRYTSGDYTDINTTLRSGEALEDDPVIAKCVRGVDTALAKSELKESIQVYRGASPKIFGLDKTASIADIEKLIGSIVTDNGYTSTSTDPKVASNYSHDKLKFNITVPAGSGRGAYIAGMSLWPEESEFLLPRGTSFVVTGVSEDKRGRAVVDMTVVDD